ncbi:hypothetical protein HHK36_015588 [Tetracentron sinense]|uniref:Peroxidase n=1 Tax=Tetracentron sinense TaxID=13715 RepID=A0A835DDS9_TETSI|nr:hypothetical protein HHK36_015588 [Tetracentron sinense]
MASLGLLIILIITFASPVSAHLSVSFYANTCPSVFNIVRSAMRAAIIREPGMGTSLLRLFYHDCFVNGCDGGILLEESTPANQNSPRVFEVIEHIKSQVDRACGHGVVSCADLFAIATRDSVTELGGPYYSVPLGRRDGRTPNLDVAHYNLPTPSENLDSIIAKFSRKGFSAREMVALSGAHTVGKSSCVHFRDRIYNESNIDAAFAAYRRATCPRATGTGDNNLAPLDPLSPYRFDNRYFRTLMNRRGLLHSDQVLFSGGSTDSIVTAYRNNPTTFSTDFANAMVKLGNLSPLTGSQGEIRTICGRVN